MLRNNSAIRALALLGTFSIAGILLYLSLRGIDWRIVVDKVRFLSPGLASLATLLGLIPMFLRAARWRILLQAEAPVSYKHTFWAVAAGYFGNNFLPARGGEVVRSYIVRSYSHLSLSYVLATALSERVADAVSLVLIGAFSLAVMPQVGDWMRLVRGSFAVIGAVGLGLLIFLPRLETVSSRLLRPWPRMQGVATQIGLGVGSLHDRRRLLKFALLTIAIWTMDALSTSTLARALNIPMPLSLSMLLIVALSLSSVLPSTPGYVGVYQFVAVNVLRPFGISPSDSIALILVTQVMSYAVTTSLGLLAITRFTPFNWHTFRRPAVPIQTQS